MVLKKLAEVTLIISAVAVNLIKGEANTTLDCMGGGQQGHSTQLVCKITGSVTTGISFIAPGGREVVQCNSDNTECIGSSGYSAVVDSQTQITLTIQSFNDTDVGTWKCKDGTNGNPSTCDKSELRPGESLDWCIAVSAVLAVLIVVGIVILILVVKEPFDDKILKTLGIVLIVVGACVIVTAVVTAILLAVKTNVDRTDGSWIAAVVFCALGFLFGAVFCAVGVIKMSKLSKKDSKPVSGNSHELRNETGTPLNK